MLKNRTVIELEVNGRTFRLECYGDSPLPDVLKAIDLYKIYVENLLKEREKYQQNVEQKDSEECPTQTPPSE